MADGNSSILVVESDPDVAEIIRTHFQEEGYQVTCEESGDKGLQACQNVTPNLIVIAVKLPDMDGFEVARRLRLDRRTQDVPIMFLNEKGAAKARLKGLEIGADDYLTKPIDIYELQLRVRNALRRAGRSTLTNPVSGLPEGALVDEKMKELLGSEHWSIVLVSLLYLEAFRDAYGFVAADDVLRAFGMTVQAAAGPEAFVGHLTTTDLVVMGPAEDLAAMPDKVQAGIVPSLESFYPLKDRDRLADLPHRLGVKSAVLESTGERFESSAALRQGLLALKG